ncbi:hypothetical protein ABIC16_001734 [Sphingomonas sp. PvP055]|uniref:hypothetical protein n=1 Tax=Sphingomonas sp. PvP055 TaxID=3156391 RepID=UPI0033994666
MEGADTVLRDEGVGDVDQLVNKVGVSRREVDTEQDRSELGFVGDQGIGDVGQVAPGDGNGDAVMFLDKQLPAARDRGSFHEFNLHPPPCCPFDRLGRYLAMYLNEKETASY